MTRTWAWWTKTFASGTWRKAAVLSSSTSSDMWQKHRMLFFKTDPLEPRALPSPLQACCSPEFHLSYLKGNSFRTLSFFFYVVDFDFADGVAMKRMLLFWQVMLVRTQLLMSSKATSRLTKKKMAVKFPSKVRCTLAAVSCSWFWNCQVSQCIFQANLMSYLLVHTQTVSKPQNLSKSCNLGMLSLFTVTSSFFWTSFVSWLV